MEIRVNNLREGYLEVLRAVLRHGRMTSPRGARTIELAPCTILVEDPRDTLPVGVGRGVSTALASLEAAHLVGGVHDPATLRRLAPGMARYEDVGSHWGAYGPRVRAQMPRIVERLAKDPETRRAVANVWDERDLHVEGVANYPCTTQLQWFARDGLLQMHTTMRANDALHGLATDCFTFAQLQLTLARCLGLGPGHYVHHDTSLHLYMDSDAGSGSDAERAEDLVDAWRVDDFKPVADGFGPEDRTALGRPAIDRWDEAGVRARMVSELREPYGATASESWMLDKICAKLAQLPPAETFKEHFPPGATAVRA